MRTVVGPLRAVGLAAAAVSGLGGCIVYTVADTAATVVGAAVDVTVGVAGAAVDVVTGGDDDEDDG